MNSILTYPITMQLNDFIDDLIYRNVSKLTIDAYKYDVSKFIEFMLDKKIKRASSIKAEHIKSYLVACKRAGKSPASINRYTISIKSYCNYLCRKKILPTDILLEIKLPKTTLKAPKIPTVEEINRIILQIDTDKETGLRDKAMLELLYSSGLRASELCNLALEDFKGDTIVVKCGKRDKTRAVPITEEASKSIYSYLVVRGIEEGYLFLTELGRPLRRQLLNKIVCRYARKADVSSVTTHTLRHACATHLLDEGADLRLIQEVLGHSSIATTQRYTHLSSNKMQQMFKQFHPRKAINELVKGSLTSYCNNNSNLDINSVYE